LKPARPQDGIAWITGASAGIGRAVALRLLQDGWTVAATARRADQLSQLANAHPGRIIAAQGDVTDAAAMQAAVAHAEGQAGRPIALAILNAGTYLPMSAESFDAAAFRAQMDVNVGGTANALAAVLPGLLARGHGQLAIVASVAGYRGLPTAIAYSATKAALIALAESLKFDLDRAGVLTHVITPGFVRTPLTDRNTFPMPFLIEADDAANRIVRGLRGTGFEITFPRRFTYILKLLRVLPYALFFPLVARGTRAR
jgi:NADP-dependent 3-hydroxy acid dehydrogenase YdfG